MNQVFIFIEPRETDPTVNVTIPNELQERLSHFLFRNTNGLTLEKSDFVIDETNNHLYCTNTELEIVFLIVEHWLRENGFVHRPDYPKNLISVNIE